MGGIHRAAIDTVRLLVENQVIFDVLVDELITQELLERYRMLILPNAEALSQEQIGVIQAFVAQGGLLIATGNTSLADVTGERRGDLGLGEVLGITLVHPSQVAPTYVHLTTGRLIDPDETISPWIFMPEGQAHVRTLEGAAEWARVGSTPKDHLSYLRHDTEFPSITSHTYAKGEAWYLAGMPGLAYARYQYPAIPRLIKRMLKPYLDADMPVRVDAPPCVQVEVALQKDPKRVIVHLISHNGPPGWTVAVQDEGMLASRVFSTGQPHTVLPVTDVRITVKGELIKNPLHMYMAPEKQILPIVQTKEGVVITLGKVGLHEMVVLESQ